MKKSGKEKNEYSEDVCGLISKKPPFVLRYGITCILVSVFVVLFICIKCNVIPVSLIDTFFNQMIRI